MTDDPKVHTTPEEGHPAGDERSDRDIGGPTGGEGSGEETGGAPGTKPDTVGLDPHTDAEDDPADER